MQVGRVARPWGRRGAMLVEPLTHDIGRFERLEEVSVRAAKALKTHRILGVRVDPRGRLIVQLDDVTSIEAAEALRGATLEIPSHLAERPPGEAYFHHELLGLRVETRAGVPVGTVSEIVETGAASLLVVRAGEREMLIPLVAAIVSVQSAAGKIQIDPPVGLLELNEARGDHAV